MFIFNAILDVQGYQDILRKLADMTLLFGEIPAFTETHLETREDVWSVTKLPILRQLIITLNTRGESNSFKLYFFFLD